MPSLNFKNHIPAVDPQLPNLPDRLEAAGLERPAGLDAALVAARWSVPGTDFDGYRLAIETASSKAEYADAVQALADAYVRKSILTGPSPDAHRLRSDLTRVNATRVQTAFRDATPGIYAGLSTEYAMLGQDFSESVRSIRPESLAADVFSLDPFQKSALDQAKVQSGRINALLDIYNEVARLSGRTKITGTRPLEAEEVACRLGEYDSMQDWATAADLIEAFANDKNAYDPAVESHNPEALTIRFSVFGPAAAVALSGSRLVLSTPSAAKEAVVQYRRDRERTAIRSGTGDGRIPV